MQQQQNGLGDSVIVPFFSLKGGTGRTTALANTAYFLARAGSRVLVVDGDVDSLGVSVLSVFQPAFQRKLPTQESTSSVAEGETKKFGHGLVEFCLEAGKQTQSRVEQIQFENAHYIHGAYGKVGFDHEILINCQGSSWTQRLEVVICHLMNEVERGGLVTARHYCETMKRKVLDIVPDLHLDGSIADSDDEGVSELVFSQRAGSSVTFRVRSVFTENKWFKDALESPRTQGRRKDWDHRGGVWVLPCMRSEAEDQVRTNETSTEVTSAGVFDDRAFQHSPNIEIKKKSEVELLQELLVHWGSSSERRPRLFDYILVDCRSGEDPFSIHAVLPVARAIVVAAHFNEQGTRLTTDFVKKLRSEGIDFADPKAKERLADRKRTPIIWFSQILPSGENFLREQRIDGFIKKFVGDESIAHDCRSKRDISMVFHNSSLPLMEDLLGFWEVISRKSPYWEVADKVKALRDEGFQKLYRDLLSEWSYLDAIWRVRRTPGISRDPSLLESALNRFTGRLAPFAWHVPDEASFFLGRLAAHHEMLADVLLYVSRGCEKLLDYYCDIPDDESASEALSGLVRSIELQARRGPDDGLGVAMVGKWTFGTLDEIAEVERDSTTIHVSTSSFEFDLSEEFGQLVRTNILHGKRYIYYTASSIKKMRDQKQRLQSQLNLWREEAVGIQKDLFEIVDNATEGGEESPAGVVFKEALPLDDFDIVVYEGYGKVTVAVFPKSAEDKVGKNLIITDRVLAQSVLDLLKKTVL